MMGLTHVQLPTNAQQFFSFIKTIAAFDYMDLNPYINTILKLESTEPFNVGFDEMGYNSMFLSNNLGTLNLAYFFYLGGLMVMYYYSTQRDKSKAAKRFYKKLRAMLVYNYIISTVMESYANIAVCAFIQLKYIRFGTWGETIQTLYAFAFCLLLLAFPLWLFVLKIRWIDVSEDTQRQGKYAAFYKDISILKGPQTLIWPWFYLSRRFILAFAIVVFSEVFIVQLFVMIFGGIAAVIISGHLKPYETSFQQRLEYFNEVCLMFIIYTIICFSPLVHSYKRKHEIGFICCIFIAFNMSVGLYFILKQNVLLLIRSFKLWRFKAAFWKQRKAKMSCRSQILTLQRSLKILNTERQELDLDIDHEALDSFTQELFQIQVFGKRAYKRMEAIKKPKGKTLSKNLKRKPQKKLKKKTSLAVIEEEASEFEMNTEQDELELFMFEMRQQDQQQDSSFLEMNTEQDERELREFEMKQREKQQASNLFEMTSEQDELELRQFAQRQREQQQVELMFNMASEEEERELKEFAKRQREQKQVSRQFVMTKEQMKQAMRKFANEFSKDIVSEEDLQELEEFKQQMRKDDIIQRQPYKKEDINFLNEIKLLTKPVGQMFGNEPQYFYANTKAGPVICQRNVPKSKSKELLDISDQVDNTLFQLEQKKHLKYQRNDFDL